MADEAIVVFTGYGKARILKEGGSQEWRLNQRRARQCEYLVCTQNRNADKDWSDPSEPQGQAFLVGKVSDVVPGDERADELRYKIQISEYAEIAIPDAWPGLQNPVHYTSLSKLGIDPDTLDFKPMPPEAQPPKKEEEREKRTSSTKGLSINEAKHALAMFYKVPATAIEIIIRG
jgi:hypothetical protein